MHNIIRVAMLFSALTMLLLASGCEDKTNPVEEYGTGLTDAYHNSQKAADSAGLETLRRSVKTFRSANERNPASLEELSGFVGISIDTNAYDYDPATGQVNLK
jgi:hypothetical protein